MDLKEYASFTDVTWKEPEKAMTPLTQELAICALGLVGEAGEVVEKIKKLIHYDRTVDLDEMDKELGDVIYYWIRLCLRCGLDPDRVLKRNMDKLMQRQLVGTIWGEGSNR